MVFGYTPYGYSTGIGAWVGVAYNGEWRDVLGLYHLGLGRRVYDCTLMRFYSADSLSPFSKGGINTYSYCGGDPVNFSDSSGAMRKSNVKKPVSTVTKKQVTWIDGGFDEKVDAVSISRFVAQGVRSRQKSILKIKHLGSTDQIPPAAPMNYDGPMMTDGQFDSLLKHWELRARQRSTHTWGSENYRLADVELRRVRRLVTIQQGIRQDRGLHDLTKPRYRYGRPNGDYLDYPEEPEIDYD